MSTYNFELPSKIESLIATLARLYEIKDKKRLQEILVNSQVEVTENVEYDNWNGGTYGHHVNLIIPEIIFFEIFDKLDDISTELCSGLNKVNTTIRDEYFHEVSIEKAETESGDWRKNSGLLLDEITVIPEVVQNRIWEPKQFRLFLSHKTDDKIQVAELKQKLSVYGISCFVAHEDIAPTQRWADEIENALFSMDACVAIMTPLFHNSDWTDHELGCAHGRHVPVIAVRMGRDPYGLIGRFQALSATWDNLHFKLLELLINYNKVKDAFIQAIDDCSSYDTGNALAKLFPHINKLSKNQVTRIISAVNSNSQARDSFGFKGGRSHGKGITYYLSQWSTSNYGWDKNGKIAEIDE